MPYASDKQKRLMQAVANNPAFAKQVGIPQSVGKKFEAHKAKGGEVMAKKLFGGKETYAEELKEAKAIKSGRITPQQYARGEQKEEAGMKMKKMAGGGMAASKMGAVKTAAPSRDGLAVKGKTKGTMVKMAGGKGMKRGGKC